MHNSFRDKHCNLKGYRNLWKCAIIYYSILASWKLQIFTEDDSSPLRQNKSVIPSNSALTLAQYISLIPCFPAEERIRPFSLAHSEGQDWIADDCCVLASMLAGACYSLSQMQLRRFHLRISFTIAYLPVFFISFIWKSYGMQQGHQAVFLLTWENSIPIFHFQSILSKLSQIPLL